MPTAIMLPRKINSTDAEDPLSCTSQKPDTSVDAHPFYLVTDALLLGKKMFLQSVDIFLQSNNFIKKIFIASLKISQLIGNKKNHLGRVINRNFLKINYLKM